jgi:hypothetical protein
LGDGVGQVRAMLRCSAEHHHPCVLAQALGVGVEEYVQLIQLFKVDHRAGVIHRALGLDRGRRLERCRGSRDRVGGAEDLVHLGGQAPCPGDNHRISQARLTAAMALQRHGLGQAHCLGQATAPGGIDER